jgi:hypothetical protein
MHLSLLPNEKVIFKTRVHLFTLFQWKTSLLLVMGFGAVIVGDMYSFTDMVIVFLAGVALLLVFIMLFESFMYWFKTYVVVTNQRVLYSIGWISPFVREISLNRISDISVGQGFFGRTLNFGTIFFNQDQDVLLPLSMIAQPYVFRQYVLSLLDPKCRTGT